MKKNQINDINLGDVIKINPDSLKPKDYPFKQIEYIDISSVGNNTLTETVIHELENAPSRAKRIVKDGDTILSSVRPNLRAFLFIKNPNSNLVVSTGFAVLRATNKINKNFLFYTVTNQEFTDYLTVNAKGAAYPAVDVDTIKRAKINLPPLPTQRKIAGILSAYDDLIENNTRRIEILEEMARMLYREWFVKFRFPGHEDVQFIESELGLIPEGWEVKKLDKLGFLGRGKSKHRPRNYPSLYGGKYPFIQTGEVKNTLLYITDYQQTYGEEGLAQSKLWEKGTLLLTIAANIAETAIITFSACFPDSIVGFVADENKVIPEFIKYQIDDLKEKMQSYSRGTTQDNLSLEKIKMFDFLVPSFSYMKLYRDHTEFIFKNIINLQQKNTNLRKTRDLLLPRLISGEIDVELLDINTGEKT